MSYIGLRRTIDTIIIALSFASTCSFGSALFSPVGGFTNTNVAGIWSTTAGGTTKI